MSAPDQPGLQTRSALTAPLAAESFDAERWLAELLALPFYGFSYGGPTFGPKPDFEPPATDAENEGFRRWRALTPEQKAAVALIGDARYRRLNPLPDFSKYKLVRGEGPFGPEIKFYLLQPKAGDQ